MAIKFTESSGNIFADLGFPPHEAAVMLLRAQLAVALAAAILSAGAAAQSRDSKKAQCASYDRQLERNTESARKGGSAKTMDRLNEERRRINAARSKAGC